MLLSSVNSNKNFRLPTVKVRFPGSRPEQYPKDSCVVLRWAGKEVFERGPVAERRGVRGLFYTMLELIYGDRLGQAQYSKRK